MCQRTILRLAVSAGLAPVAACALAEPPSAAKVRANAYDGTLAACFAPGTDPEIIEAFTRDGFGRARRDGVAYVFSDVDRWPGDQGDPMSLTWSFVPDGVEIYSAGDWDNGGASGPSELFDQFDGLFGGDRALWMSLFEDVFERWGEFTGITYTRITFGGDDWDDGAFWGASGGVNRGDFRIAMRNIDGLRGVLAYNYFPWNGDMVLDRNTPWRSPSGSYQFLRNVVMHEHGHGLGIDHVCPFNGTKLMEASITSAFDGPQHDDIRAGHRGYGDPFEPDNSTGLATDLGVMPSGRTINVGTGSGPDDPFPFPSPSVTRGSILSIDATGEQDYFRFQVDGPGSVTIAMTPVGHTYDSSTQRPDGGCNSGNLIDSLAVADLNMQLIDSDGVTLLSTAASEPAGGTETIASSPLASAGNVYLRVYEGGSPSESQLYSLSITFTQQGPIPTVSEWGTVATTLLMLAAGTLVLMRRRAAQA